MKKIFKALIVILLSFTNQFGWAKHLVGGDITYRYIGNFSGMDRYEITITLIRDCVGGNTEFDDPLEATLYNAGNFSDMKTVVFNYPGESFVPLTSYNPCATPPEGICYSVTKYIKTIDVTPNSNGYYLVYERCCRNNTINNLSNPGAMGMILSCYIPNSNLKNSSPIFGALPPTYICLGDTFRFPQNATDIDGDRLEYQLSTPYHGGSQQDPAPSPDIAPPFPFVVFANGYNVNNMLGNSPQPLVIDQNGELLAICNTPGQFVFAVSVFEYRNNVLISETKRDIQVNVVRCPPNVAPVVNLPSNPLIVGDTLKFSESINSCITFEIKDPNSRDSVFATFNSVITNNQYSNATISFQPNLTPATVQVCWKPTCEQVDSVFPVTVNIRDNYACGNNENLITLFAKVYPTNLPNPTFSCASVLSNDQIVLNFPNNYDDKQDKIFIYRQNSGSSSWQLIDSLLTPLTTYTDNSINDANTQSYCYKISVRKNCNGVLSFLESNSVCTILIDHQNINISSEQITWTNFIHSGGINVIYNLEFEENGITSIVQNVTSPYIYKNCSFKGKVRVKAVTGSCESFSAFTNIFELSNIPPTPIELCYVSVAENNGGVELEWTKSLDGNLKNYEIWRLDNNNWSKITSVDTNTNYYIDRSAQVTEKSYKYYIRAVDDCDAFVRTSDYSTILLKSSSEPYFVDLSWSSYINDFPVLNYVLLKNQLTRNDFTEDINFSSLEFSYRDNSIEKSKGIYCYKIKANAPGNCGNYSYSNSVCETFPIILYIPNAFSPNGDGKNDEFSVYGEFIESFQLKIYDRWGKLTYELNNPNQTWNGMSNGKNCPEDVYVYFFEAKGFMGETIKKSGSITLIR